MTIQWIRDSEANSSTIARLGTRGTLSKDVPYIVLGAATEDEIHVAANAYISSVVPTWTYPNQPSVKLLAQSYDVEYLGDNSWRVTVHYERQGADDDSQQSPLKRSRSFDTGGGSRHVTQALKGLGTTSGLMKWTSAGSAAVSNNEYAIGWDGEQVHGVDVIEPALTWSESYDVPSSYVTSAYIKSLAAITGSVNKAAFRSFDAGEVLLVGTAGSQQWDNVAGDGPWSLQFRFEARPNAGNGKTLPSVEVGSITGIEKRGHDYLWVRYGKTVESGKILPAAEEVFVGKVYRDGDFSLLGIGTT